MMLSVVSPSLVLVLTGIFALLLLATSTVGVAVAAIRVFGGPSWIASSPILPELRARLRSWWIMAASFSVCLILGRVASLTFLALVSFLVLREYLSVTPFHAGDRAGLFVAYATIPLQYGWIARGHADAAAMVPIAALAVLGAIVAMRGRTQNFLRSSALIIWGVMIAIVALGHLALIAARPASLGYIAGGPGLLLFIVFVCQIGDVAQYIAGKSLGRRLAVPGISPNKTIAGYVGGLITAALAAAALGPYLTPMSPGESLAIGAALGILGCLGGLTISAVKRDLGIKDMGRLLPGHGGALDRADSLVFSAPFFYHYLVLAH
ncbi:MAG TPA: phosphatidate cytidylyltransferase [Stellaceae bacterium]|nr:phosphatidate cytidylyltransferase [Stellaceae bacterium]